MKIRIHLKDPDGVYDSINAAVVTSIRQLGLSEREASALIDARTEEVTDALGKWIKYGEYVSIEFDTEAGTATVCEVRP